MSVEFPSESTRDERGIYRILTCESGAAIAYRQTKGVSDAPGILFLGGFRSDMTGNKAEGLDSFCRASGLGFTRFDYQGHGCSGGRFEACTLDTWLGDTLSVLDHLTDGPQILIGSSMGGWIAFLLARLRPKRIHSIIAIAPALDFTEELIWKRLTEDQQIVLETQGGLTIPSSYDPAGYRITDALIKSGRNHLLLNQPIAFEGPIRILHGMMDEDVPWHHSVKLTERVLSTDVILTLIKDGDHRLSRDQDLGRLYDTLAHVRGIASGVN